MIRKYVALFFLAGALLLTQRNRLKVEKINCFIDSLECPSTVNSKLSSQTGKYLWEIKLADLAKLVYPFQITKIDRKTGQVTISAEPPKARAMLTILTEPELQMLVTEDSYIIGPGTADLPEVIIPKGNIPITGERISDPNIGFALKLALALANSFASTEILVAGQTITIKGISSAEIVTSSSQDPDWVANALQQLLRKSTIEGRMPSKIDLRFSQAIVKY